jgi:hypothetical protein
MPNRAGYSEINPATQCEVDPTNQEVTLTPHDTPIHRS